MVIGGRGAQAATVFPVEVTQGSGSLQTLRLLVLAPTAARTLVLTAHGITFDGEASIAVNQGPWQALAPTSYSRIGARVRYSFPVTLPSPLLTLSLRFNGTDGITSEWRLLDAAVQDATGKNLIAPGIVAYDDPAKWSAPLTQSSDIQAGRLLYTATSLPAASPLNPTGLNITCADCHASDGRDLRFFNYSNASIIARCQFHGFSWQQGAQIASYIRSLPASEGSVNGRPWNPPYQPGPGLDSRPVSEWAAGAGADAVLQTDQQMLPYLFPGGTISKAAISTDQTLNMRELPVALTLPDWNHWLPTIHPRTAYTDFDTDNVNLDLPKIAGALLAQNYPSANFWLQAWTSARRAFVGKHNSLGFSSGWSVDQAQALYSVALWQMVKTWELMQTFHLEDQPSLFYGTHAEARGWPVGNIFITSPYLMFIPQSAGLFGDSPVAYEALTNGWYELQIVLNAGNYNPANDHSPVDWNYTRGRIKNLGEMTGTPYGARMIAALVKAMQEYSLRTPAQGTAGFSPGSQGYLLDLVHPSYFHEWDGYDPATKAGMLTALVGAWLDKSASYPASDYYQGGLASPTEDPSLWGSRTLGHTTWTSIPLLEKAGLDPSLANALISWAATVWPVGHWQTLAPATTSTTPTNAVPTSGSK